MRVDFTKMHGLGNDFVVLDARAQPLPGAMTRQVAAGLAHRHTGIGCDQLIVLEPSSHADFAMRIFNADGGEVEACGNATRAVGLLAGGTARIATVAGILETQASGGGISVDMGEPRFQPAEIPFLADDDVIIHLLDVADETLETTVVSMGNPHAVQVVDDVDTHPVGEHGPLIERHERFPKRVNAGFMQIVDEHHIKLRVYERGSGETLACGTGACAAAVAGIRRGLLASPVRVATRGGELNIAWGGPGRPVLMTGPAVTVFEGEIEL